MASSTQKSTSSQQQQQKFSYLAESNQTAETTTKSQQWQARLDQNVAGAQGTAEDFTKEFIRVNILT